MSTSEEATPLFCSQGRQTCTPVAQCSPLSTKRPCRSSAFRKRRRRPVRRRRPDRAPAARSATTARPESTTARRRATAARASSGVQCARVTCTRAGSSAAVSSTRTSGTSVDTADCASVSGRECAKKVRRFGYRVFWRAVLHGSVTITITTHFISLRGRLLKMTPRRL